MVNDLQKKIFNFLPNSRADALYYLNNVGVGHSQMVDVLYVFLNCGAEGATDAEVSEVLGIERTSVIARRHDLIKRFPDLFYVDAKRLSKHGVLCDVWRCKE